MSGAAASGSAIKKCHRCQVKLSLDRFETRIVKGELKLYSNCVVCRPKVNADALNDKAKARAKRYQQSEKGKANQKRCMKRYDESEKGKAKRKRFWKSEKGKAASKRFWKSDKGKAARKRARESEAGQVFKKHRKELFSKRRNEDPAFAMMCNIKCAASNLMSGRIKTSPTFVARTGFRSEEHFLSHMNASVLGIGMTMRDYGKEDGWENEHKIPVDAYDFSDPTDIKRCWSPENVRACLKNENEEKGFKIIDSLCTEVGAAKFPAAWGGEIPDEAAKETFYAKCLAPYDAVGEEEDEEDDEDEEDEEEDEEEEEEEEEEDEEEDEDVDLDAGDDSDSD